MVGLPGCIGRYETSSRSVLGHVDKDFAREIELTQLQDSRLARLSLFCVEFSVDRYCVRLFDDYGISLPAAIESSVPKRQAEFLAGRIAADIALENRNYSRREVGIGLNGSPIWPQGIVGSISHSQRLAIAGVASIASFASVGVDIEHRSAGERLQKTTNSICSDREVHVLATHLPNLSPPLRTTLIFSAKEAAFKAVHPFVGRYLEFNAFRVVSADALTRQIWLENRIPIASLNKQTRTLVVSFFDFSSDHVVTVTSIPDVHEVS